MSKSSTWKSVPLSDLCRVVEGQVDPRDAEYRDLPHVNGEVIETGTGRLLEVRTAAEDGLISGKYLFEQGMILYSKLRPYLRKVTITPTRGVCSADMYPLVFDPKRVDTLFAMFSLLAEPFTAYAVSESRRARMPKLNRSQLLAWEMPLPKSLDDQRRIAAGLKQSLAAVDTARRAAEECLAAAESLPAAYLREVFEGPEVSSWNELTLGDVVRTPIRTGVSKPGRPTSNKRCLTLSAVRGRTLLLEASKPVDVSDADAERNWLRPGCFYVIRGNGNRKLVGRGAFAPDALSERMLFPDLLFQVDLGKAVDPLFFWCLWCSAPVRRELEERARTAAGIYKINTSNLNSLPLRLPAIGEQRLIAADLSRRLQAAESVIAGCREELATIEAFPASLLRATFNGDS